MPTLLVISGLDPTGGAGLLADARVAAEHQVRAVGVITASTVQDTSGVRSVLPLPAEHVGEALAALLGDVEVDAVKIGMLGDVRIAEVIARALAATSAPVVWDPVFQASRGAALLSASRPESAGRVSNVGPCAFGAWLESSHMQADRNGRGSNCRRSRRPNRAGNRLRPAAGSGWCAPRPGGRSGPRSWRVRPPNQPGTAAK